MIKLKKDSVLLLARSKAIKQGKILLVAAPNLTGLASAWDAKVSIIVTPERIYRLGNQIL